MAVTAITVAPKQSRLAPRMLFSRQRMFHGGEDVNLSCSKGASPLDAFLHESPKESPLRVLPPPCGEPDIFLRIVIE